MAKNGKNQKLRGNFSLFFKKPFKKGAGGKATIFKGFHKPPENAFNNPFSTFRRKAAKIKNFAAIFDPDFKSLLNKGTVCKTTVSKGFHKPF